MAVIEETTTEIVWRGPTGVVRLSKTEYEVVGGTVRRKERPEPVTTPVTLYRDRPR